MKRKGDIMENPKKFDCGELCRALLDQWSAKFAEMDKDFLRQRRLPKRKDMIGPKRGSNFIFEAQKRLKRISVKLKQLEVAKLYRQNQQHGNGQVGHNGQGSGEMPEPQRSPQVKGLLVDRKQK